MQIEISNPPEAAVQAAVRGLEQVFSDGGPTGLGILETGATSLDLAVPHQVYHVGLEAVAAGNLLASAEPIAWRFLVIGQGDAVLAAVEVVPDEEGSDYTFARVNQGAFVGSTSDAALRAEASGGEPEGTGHEFRLLRVPSLYLYAVWLHGRTDTLIPLSPAPYDLVPNEPQSSRVIAEHLRLIAQARLKEEARLTEESAFRQGEREEGSRPDVKSDQPRRRRGI